MNIWDKFTCIVHHILPRVVSFAVQTVCRTGKVSIYKNLHDLCIEYCLFYRHCLYPKIAMSNFLGLLWVINITKWCKVQVAVEKYMLDFKPVAHGSAITFAIMFILSTQITLSQMRTCSVDSILWYALTSSLVVDGESGNTMTAVKAIPKMR